jgi:hypothetical protein
VYCDRQLRDLGQYGEFVMVENKPWLIPQDDGSFTNANGHRMEIDHPMVNLELHEKVAKACQKQHHADLDRFDGTVASARANVDRIRKIRQQVIDEYLKGVSDSVKES